jgi:hypothetical protein
MYNRSYLMKVSNAQEKLSAEKKIEASDTSKKFIDTQ